jgi:cellulose synthase/poly-beta-1,6-N-acetylglucosamine synthase-like glycosyltransferase
MDGAICVGTNALYNIKALEQVGGYEGVGRKEWGHSEDVNTGLKIINSFNADGERYRIKYIPVILATGTCPDNHLSFYKQQNRWATGSMQLVLSKKTLFSKNLTAKQKLCYLANSAYYLYTIAILLSPLQLLVLLLMNSGFDWQATLLFLPSLMLGTVIGPVVLRRRIHPIAGSLVVLSNAYTFAQALFLLAIRRPLGWEATGSTTSKARNAHFTYFKIFCSIFFAGIYLSVFSVTLINQRFYFTPSLIISVLFGLAFISHLIYLHYMLSEKIKNKKPHKNSHVYAYALILIMLASTASASISIANKYDVKFSPKNVITLKKQT